MRTSDGMMLEQLKGLAGNAGIDKAPFYRRLETHGGSRRSIRGVIPSPQGSYENEETDNRGN